MDKIAFIIIYFGKFNNYFQLFLNSCGFNKDVFDVFIWTDDNSSYEYPTNVKVIYTSFEEMKYMIQEKFNFKIEICSPYKLCDFKPAYGYIMYDFIRDYKYWGHCDTDIIWGDAKKFLLGEDLKQYDKLFFLGHCTIYKNEYSNNCAFMQTERYKEVFSNKSNMSFDEEFNNSVNNEFDQLHKKVLYEEYEANLLVKANDFYITRYDFKLKKYINEKKNRLFFIWNKGELIGIWKDKNGYQTKEYMYIHLQSRKMKNNVGKLEVYKIIPNCFERVEDLCDYNRIKKRYVNFNYFRVRTNNLYKKIKKRIGFKYEVNSSR